MGQYRGEMRVRGTAGDDDPGAAIERSGYPRATAKRRSTFTASAACSAICRSAPCGARV